jgi:hypothetical protein
MNRDERTQHHYEIVNASAFGNSSCIEPESDESGPNG